MSGSPVSTVDDCPARAFGTLQYVPTGVAAAFPNDRLGSPAGNPENVLIDTIAALRSEYLNNAVWVMNQSTAATIQKWRDADGRSLWQNSATEGTRPMLLGYPVERDDFYPDIGANAFPMSYGHHSQGHQVVQGRISVVRDEVTTPGFTKFYMWRQLSGNITNSQAVKLVKVAAS